MSVQPTDGELGLDVQIRRLYRERARAVDIDRFAAALDGKLAARRPVTRSTAWARRPAVRRLSLALACLVVLALAGVGVWQAAERIGGGGEKIVFGDTAETTALTGPATSAPLGATTVPTTPQETGGALALRNTAEREVFLVSDIVLQHFVGGEDLAMARAAVAPAAVASFDDMVASLQNPSGFQILGSQSVGGSQVVVTAEFREEDAVARYDFTTQVNAVSAEITAIVPVPSTGAGAQGVVTGDQPSLEFDNSLDTLKLSEVWKKAAEAVQIDPDAARLDNLQLSWDKQGRLTEFMLYASVPDGRRVSVEPSEPLALSSASRTIGFHSALVHEVGGLETQHSGAALSVAQVLAALDEVGLPNMIGQMGLDIDAPPTDPSLSSHIPSEVTAVYWTVYLGAGAAAMDDPYTVSPYAEDATYAVSGAAVQRLHGGDSTASILPALDLSLSRTWVAADGWYTIGGESGTVLLNMPSERQAAADERIKPQPANKNLDGLAFAWLTGTYRMVAGTLRSVGSEGPGKIVSYSVGRDWLLAQEYTRIGDAGSGIAARLVAVPMSGGASRTFLEGSQLLHEAGLAAKYDEERDQLWLSTTCSDLSELGSTVRVPRPALWTATGQGDLVKVALQSAFGGDFDVATGGTRLVYSGPSRDPAHVVLREDGVETELATGLATAYDPVFSPDGNQICLVGSREHSGPTALWLLDLTTGACTEIGATEGLTPTHPAFSPDGKRLAFRGFWDGRLWTVDIGSGELNCYTFQAEGAPIPPSPGSSGGMASVLTVTPVDGPLAW